MEHIVTDRSVHRVRAVPLAVALAIAAAGCRPDMSTDPIGAGPDVPAQAAPPSVPTTSGGESTPAATPNAGPYPPPANRGPYPAQNTSATAEGLVAALRTCDGDALSNLAAIQVSLRQVPGGAVDIVSNDDLGRFIFATLCQPSDEPIAFTNSPTSLRPVTETLRGAYDPARHVAGVLFAAGRGADRRAEARLVLLRESDGSVKLGAVEYAPAGFDAPADAIESGHRTVRMTLNKAGQSVEIDVPAAWHSERSGGNSGRITSYLPYAYDLGHAGTNEGWGPGQTTMEFYTLEGLRSESIDGFIRSATYYGEPPAEIQQEHFTLPSGETAVLARFTYSWALSTQLFIETDNGVVGVACEGDQAPCDAILRSARIR